MYEYLLWFLFFLLGFSFAKIINSFGYYISVILFAQKTFNELTKVTLLIEEELLYLKQQRIKSLKESNMSDEDISKNIDMFDNIYAAWKEAFIVRFTKSMPIFISDNIPFKSWNSALNYAEKVIKNKG